MSVEILQGLGLAKYFRSIYGGDSFDKKKPDPAGALTILEELGVPPAQAAMIGDSEVDVQTARNAGMFAVAVELRLRRARPHRASRRPVYRLPARSCAPHARSPPLNHRRNLPLHKPLHSPTRFCQTHRVLIGLFPELDAPGGIQRASRHLAFVLSEFAASQGKWNTACSA